MKKEIFERNLKGMRLRHKYIQDLAVSKNCQVDWENMKSHYVISVENKNTGIKDEEIILTKGVPTTKMIHDFYDIFEMKLESIENK
jgi:hypothetical protein